MHKVMRRVWPSIIQSSRRYVQAKSPSLQPLSARSRIFSISRPYAGKAADTTAAPNESSEEDQFSEMMDDRTNALLQSLGVDAQQFDEQSRKQEKKGKIPVPLVAAIDVNSRPLQMISHRQHFFDTQDVYSELRSAGLTPGQSEVIMRTMQDLISDLVNLCKDRAVPISAGANEAYLFDAASSEVRNEIANSRQSQATTYRSGLARLQRDIEILEHEATELTSLLKSDLDIEVHERKNSARAEENTIQLKIQELNNKITTRLNSDLKSEIENLRWQITRRSLAAIAIIAGLLIWLTQTNTRTKTAKTNERRRQSSGQSVPVPVLAPSMAPTEDYFGHGSTVMHVEDLSSFAPSGSSTVKQPAGDGSPQSDSSHGNDDGAEKAKFGENSLANDDERKN